uniref:Tetraspanin n=1 Tax=Sinocyclocheilus grahami TaxID=75366 RepID=A0A672RZE9_SINGR
IQCTCRILLGSLLLSMGLWILLSENRIFIPSPPYISISLFSYFLIISGSVTMSLGFLGCLGSLKTVKCLLATYFILLTVLLAAQIVGCAYKLTLTGTLRSLKQDITSTIISPQAKCCGWHGTEDWEDSIPCSCYNIGNATVNLCLFSLSLSKGCSENIKEWLDENLLIILVVILAISVVEICGMILSMCLYKEGSVDYNTILH